MNALRSEVEPLWRSALVDRERAKLLEHNRSSRSRLVLASLLARAGYPVGLVAIHAWTRAQQGQAYLWAYAFTQGREDVPAPAWVVEAAS